MASPPSSIVFGASGIVGQNIVRLLSEKVDSSASGPTITAVSRSGNIPVLADLPGVCCKTGDALDEEKTLELCQGANVIYGSIGLPYFGAVWEKEFPLLVESLLKAAAATGAVLVWIDNLYMFGPEAAASGIPMKETSREFTEYGRKPKVRSRLDKMLLDAADSGRCKVALLRASDFYGPGVKKAMVGEHFFPPLLKGCRITVFGDPKTKHTLTYVPDLARAAIAVAEGGESAWGRAWHCPNAPAESTEDIARKAAELLSGESGGTTKPVKFMVISGMLRRVLSLFVPPLREMGEMSFIWESDYLVDHSDFSAKFPELGLPTAVDEGLRDTVEWWRADAEADSAQQA